MADIAPDVLEPSDEAIQRLLNDPEIRASLDEQYAALERGDLETYSHEEVRTRLRQLGVPLGPPPAQA